MRICKDDKDLLPNQTLAGFCEDLPDGGIRIQCKNCKKEQNVGGAKPSDYKKKFICNQCNFELFYPGWASW